MKKNKGTGVMLGAIILMVVIVAVIFIVFFVNNGGNDYTSLVNSNNVQTNESKNEVEIVDITNNVTENSTTDEQIDTGYEESFLGNYTWENEYDTISFELTEENGVVNYRMLYYPNDAAHASEELWGTWNTNQTNIITPENKNESPIATYSFSDITYNKDGSIEVTIQTKDVLNAELENYKIPDGKYTFEKDK